MLPSYKSLFCSVEIIIIGRVYYRYSIGEREGEGGRWCEGDCVREVVRGTAKEIRHCRRKSERRREGGRERGGGRGEGEGKNRGGEREERGRREGGEREERGRREGGEGRRSEEHTSELQSRPHISYAGFCLKKKKRRYAY